MRACCAAAWKRDEGQALVEYSLILALVAAGLVTVLLLLRDSVGNSYHRVGDRVDRAGLPVTSPGGSGSGEPARSGAGGKGDHGCGGGNGGGLGQGGGGGCGGGRDR